MPAHDIPFHPSPCVFKADCKACLMTSPDERPHACVGLDCEFYTPCRKCGANKTLNDHGRCAMCSKDKTGVTATTKDGQSVEVPRSMAKAVSESTSQEISGEDFARPISLSQPGNPPSNYTEEEKAYYQGQWDEYRSFYRDPTTKAICHNIIIMEVELGWLVNYMINHRGQPLKEMESQRNRIIKNISDLRSQLPEKEATEESDDDRFLSMIYEKYLAEKNQGTLNGVRRIFSKEALALAPTLTFPLDPLTILKRLGYETIDAEQAVQSLAIDQLPSDPRKTLEWMGFFLDEKFALPFTPELPKEEALADAFDAEALTIEPETDPGIDDHE